MSHISHPYTILWYCEWRHGWVWMRERCWMEVWVGRGDESHSSSLYCQGPLKSSTTHMVEGDFIRCKGMTGLIHNGVERGISIRRKIDCWSFGDVTCRITAGIQYLHYTSTLLGNTHIHTHYFKYYCGKPRVLFPPFFNYSTHIIECVR